MSQGVITRGATLRATVTNADLEYVGSATVHAIVCDAAQLADQQLVELTNERTGERWATYVIRADESSGLPRNVISMNGPGAYFVRVGDVVSMSTPTTVPPALLGEYVPPKPVDIVGRDLDNDPPAKAVALPPHGLLVEKCAGKMHRLRTTSVRDDGASPEVFVDPDWLDEIGLPEYANITVANVTTAGRLFGCVRAGARGSRCADIVRRGKLGGEFKTGDVIILMAYAQCDWRKLLDGDEPQIKVAFPFEKPVFQPPPETENGINVEQLKADTK